MVGLACSEGLFLGSRCVESGNRANFAAAERLLMNREVNAIVVENGPVSILDDGLAYDRCQVGLVTGPARRRGPGGAGVGRARHP